MERKSFCLLPSPLMDAAHLAAAVGVKDLFVKRDDLLGRLLGGNKLRKLEFILADALAAGADTLITCGSFESNHVLLTAAVARQFNLHFAAVLMGPSGDRSPTLNERLAVRLGGDLRRVLYDRADASARMTARLRMQEAMDSLRDELRGQGRCPYVVPEGGCCLAGTYAFVEAFDELHRQMAQLGIGAYDIYLGVGSGSTLAGLWCGAARAGADVGVRGVSIAHPNPRCKKEAVRAAARVCEHLGLRKAQVSDLDVWDEFIGPGYGEATEGGSLAIDLALRTEGLLLDPTYTGKALGGMLSLLKETPPRRPVVFWHTGGVSGALEGLLI